MPAANDAAAATVVSGGKTSITARQVIRQVYQESGLLGFYRGIGMSVMQFAPSSAVSERRGPLTAPLYRTGSLSFDGLFLVLVAALLGVHLVFVVTRLDLVSSSIVTGVTGKIRSRICGQAKYCICCWLYVKLGETCRD